MGVKEKKDALAWNLLNKHSRERMQRGSVLSLHSHHLVPHGLERMGWQWQPFMFFPIVGSSRPPWLLSPALSMGSRVLFLTMVLSWDSPRLCLAGTC